MKKTIKNSIIKKDQLLYFYKNFFLTPEYLKFIFFISFLLILNFVLSDFEYSINGKFVITFLE